MAIEGEANILTREIPRELGEVSYELGESESEEEESEESEDDKKKKKGKKKEEDKRESRKDSKSAPAAELGVRECQVSEASVRSVVGAVKFRWRRPV